MSRQIQDGAARLRRLQEHGDDTEVVYQGAILTVRRDNVRLPDGGHSVREYVCHPGAVVIIAQLASGNIVFEHQFRYPLDRVFIELPAGKIDAGEDLQHAAERELREETGYCAEQWHHLGVMHPCIGYSDEKIEIFVAQGLTQQPQQLDPGEFIELLEMSVSDVEDSIQRGEITDGKTITAFYRALPFLRR